MLNQQSQTHTDGCTLKPPYEYLLKWAESRPNAVYLKQIRHRRFETYTFAQVADHALRLVSALNDLGLKPEDRIAIVSKNCAEWFICDLAIMLGGFVSVPVFPTANADTIDYCITHSECKAAFIGKLDDATSVLEILAQKSQLISISLPYDSAPHCQYQYNQLIHDHQPTDQKPEHNDESLMSIVYTSGTSGTPKGAMLSYGGFSWSVNQLSHFIGINSHDRLFSYLPLSHITERVYIFGSSIVSGAQTAFPESLDTFIEDVRMHRPTLFISVPRLWTLFQQRILDTLPQKRLDLLLKIPLVRNIVRNKVAHALGLNKARVLGCGSAPVSPDLLDWYDHLGLKITEAWGMTESFAYSTLNYPYKKSKIGTVGQAGPGITLKIADEGEVWVHGKGVFSGYYKNEQATREVLTEDGWLKTGDIGRLDPEGYLTLLGRKNDTFKTAKGKFVSPVPIEKKLYHASRVEMLCLIGLGLPGPILLVVPHNIPHFDKARYERSARRIVEEVNQELQSHEQIKGVLMVKEVWNIENGILTPTLKIKRHLLEKKYHQLGLHWPKDKFVVWEELITENHPYG
ncbi:AMP-binding protein [Vibrio mangrovi]|uniref:AMP-binding protein n=1 Tax=Vibrio mangrovi TaxID=474394 RepID=A0A1Y6IRJ3_9VIBR|nr:AMP-binding protein [Vibrio mangrovi]MDW6001684.1 AMP-binding protein [Vibrio mangrovi]SMS00289.1 Long-chain-fatty-acid--CoA ligase FadD15 [Vibrio mangrovi]